MFLFFISIGLETPKYSVVYDKPTFQIRKYEGFAVCSMMLVDKAQQQGPAGVDGDINDHQYHHYHTHQKIIIIIPIKRSSLLDPS
jgi:hypothetical protein